MSQASSTYSGRRIMRLRTVSLSAPAIGAALLVFAIGCGPDDGGSTTSDGASEASSAEATSAFGDDSTSKPTDGSKTSYPAGYICKQVTAAEATSAFGVNVTTTPNLQPKGMALCTYTINDNAGFTIGYMSDASWHKHTVNIGDGPGKYEQLDDNTLVMVGPLGGACAVRDDNGMMIFMQGMGFTELVDKGTFDKFCTSLRGEIN